MTLMRVIDDIGEVKLQYIGRERVEQLTQLIGATRMHATIHARDDRLARFKKLFRCAPAPLALMSLAFTHASADAQAVSSANRAPAASNATSLQEIVITAQKERSTLQKTAAAVTAYSGQQLITLGVTDLRAAQVHIPSVRFQAQAAATEVYIRGVGSSIDAPQNEAPTSVNFNGVYVPRNATGGAFFDLQQIEVLPGPQGTLYGRSTLGGAVQILANRPTRDLESDSLIEAGNHSLAHISSALNVPLSDTLFFRGAFDYQYHKGYQRSGADSANNFSGRLSLLFKPTDRFSAYLWGNVTDLKGHPANLVSRGVNQSGAVDPEKYVTSDPWNDLYPAALLPLPNGQVTEGSWRYKNILLGAELNWQLGDNVTLTYIPSYLDFYAEPHYYFGGFKVAASERDKQTTHELRLSGTSGALTWIAGLYGYRLTSGGDVIFAGFSTTDGGFNTSDVAMHRIWGVAAFGQATYHVSNALRLIAGGRYSHDDRVGDGSYFSVTGPALYSYSKKFNHADFKLGVEYDLARKVMLYGTIQSGYQPGTFNQFRSSLAVPNEVAPSKLLAFTGGFKSRFFDDRLQINNEAFFYNYKDLMVSAYDALTGSTRTFNAQRAHIYGDQLDIIFRPTSTDQFHLDVGYLHARYKQFVLPNGTSYAGNQLQYAPDWTLNAGYFHDFEMPHGYLRAMVNTRYESSWFADYLHTPGTFQGSYTKTDASLTYYDGGGKWSFGVWAKNLENADVEAATATGSVIPFNPLGATTTIEPPRTFGVRATLRMK